MKILEKVLGAAAALALAASLVACAPATGNGTNYSKAAVSGVVTQYVAVVNSNAVVKGLEGAKVTMGKYSATTDKNGVWTIPGVEPGEYYAYVSKDGYSEAVTANKITVNADTYEKLGLDSENALKEELLKTISALGAVQFPTTDKIDGNLGGTIDKESGTAGVGASAPAIHPDLLKWFNTSVATYNYEYAIVADAMVITPLTAGLKGTIKLRPTNGAMDEINVADKVAGANIKVSVYDSAKSTLYAVTTTNDKGQFEIAKGLPAYAKVGTDVVVTVEPFKEGNLVYGTVAAKGMTAATLLPEQVIDAQDFCFAAVLEEDCVNVVETNIGKKTQEAPIALNTPITFTFDREIESIAFKAGINFVENTNYRVTRSEDKKTITLTPIPSIWEFGGDVEISALVTTDGYNQDALIQKTFSVKFVDGPYMVAFNNADVSRISDTKTIEVNKSEPIVVEFDKEIDYVSAIKLSSGAAVNGNYKVTDPEIVVDGKKVTINPKKTADGKAEFKTETYLELTVVAKDKTVGTAKVASISYASFKVLDYDIVEQSTIPTTARAVAVTATQALKITFNGAVKEVKNAKVAGKPAVAKVDGNVVYILFNDLVNTEAESAVTADVYPVVGDMAAVNTDSIKYQAEATYEIVSANWGGKGKSVNGSTNDSAVEKDKLLVTDSIELTFNKEFAEGSVVTAEIYKTSEVSNSVSVKSYANTATVAGKVVTIKPAVKLEKGTSYSVAISVAKDNITAFTTKRGVTVADDYSSILSADKKYVVFTTAGNPDRKQGVNDKTTVAVYDTTKKILPTESIVIEYKDSVAGTTFYATYADIANPETKKAAFEVTSNYLNNKLDATITVDGKVVTVKPNGVLGKNKVYIFWYDDEGKYITKYTVNVDTETSLKEALKAPVAATKPVLVTKDTEIDSVTTGFEVKVASLKTLNTTYSLLKSVKNKYGNESDYSLVTATTASDDDVIRGVAEYKLNATKLTTDQDYGVVKYIATVEKGGLITASEALEVADKVAPIAAAGADYTFVSAFDKKTVYMQSTAATGTKTLKLSEKVIVEKATMVTSNTTATKPSVEWGYAADGVSLKFTGTAKAGESVDVEVKDYAGNKSTIKVLLTAASSTLTFAATDLSGANTNIKLTPFKAAVVGNKITITSDSPITEVSGSAAGTGITALTVDGAGSTVPTNKITITLTGNAALGDVITVNCKDVYGNSVTKTITVVTD